MNNELEAPHVDGYMLLFRGNPWESEDLSTDQLQEVMDKVTAWFDKLQQAGKLVGGHPLMDRAKVISGDGGRSVTDGPYAEAKEAIGGFVSLNADSMEEAVAIARSNPMLKYGLITEVREIASDCPCFHRARQKLAATAAVA